MYLAPGSTRVQFGPFELDLQSGELSRLGRRVRLQGQSFLILTVLIERAGEVVTRDELQQRVWPADTYVDFEHGLNNAIKRLREALNDSSERPRYIETLPRKGYRFIAELTQTGFVHVRIRYRPRDQVAAGHADLQRGRGRPSADDRPY